MDDPEKWLEKLIKWQASYLLGMVGGYPYNGPPVGRIVTDVYKTGQQVQQGEIDEPAVVALVRLMGDVLGIPASDGHAPATALLMGPPPKD